MPPLSLLSGSPYSSSVSHPSLEKGTCLRHSTMWVWGEYEAGYSLQSRRAQKMYGLSIFNYSKGRYYMCNTCTHTQYTSQCTSQRRFDMYHSFVVFQLVHSLILSLCKKGLHSTVCTFSCLFHTLWGKNHDWQDLYQILLQRYPQEIFTNPYFSLSLFLPLPLSLSLPFPPSPSYMHMYTLTLSSWPFYWKLKIPRLRNLSLCLKLGCGILLFAIKTLYNNSAFGSLSIRMDYKDLYNSGEQNDSINISGEKYIATMILYSKKKRRETLHGSEGLSERCFSVQQVKSLKKKKTSCRSPLISGKII